MKNRTLLGVLCIVLAVIVMFVVTPLVNRLSDNSVEVIRLSANVDRGTVIGMEHVETVSVKASTLPTTAIRDLSQIIGKYAVSDLYAGDYFTKEKVAERFDTSDQILSALDGTKMAVSITIDTFAGGLSAKLQNGDIISLLVYDPKTAEVTIPAELTYIQVITTTTAGGVDRDKITINSDGTSPLPSTITVLVNTEQAKLLAYHETNSTIHASLVYRGDAQNAQQFLDKQNAVFGGMTS